MYRITKKRLKAFCLKKSREKEVCSVPFSLSNVYYSYYILTQLREEIKVFFR